MFKPDMVGVAEHGLQRGNYKHIAYKLTRYITNK